ncbi:MAG: hypothetical protein KC485_09030 [Gemmatimonadetes bacterium]|nr:hypothetical protein [Gemmatimonadota bacterium]
MAVIVIGTPVRAADEHEAHCDEWQEFRSGQGLVVVHDFGNYASGCYQDTPHPIHVDAMNPRDGYCHQKHAACES